MTIHVHVLNNKLGYQITITDDPHPTEGFSVENFKLMVRKALNCWDDAPAELKQLGDMLDHGRILQDYSGNRSMQNISSGDKGEDKYPGISNADLPVCEYCGGRGEHHYHSCPAIFKTIMGTEDDTGADIPETSKD